MARPDADDTLTQIHRLPNEIIGAAELKPVFRFGRRLQVGVSTGVQDDVLLAPPKKDDIVSTGVQVDGIHADAGNNKDDTVSTAKAKAKAEAEAMEKARAKAEAEARRKAEEAMAKAKAEAEEKAMAKAKAEAEAKAKAYEKTVAKLKAQLADVRKVRADSEARLKEDLEVLEEARRKADEARTNAEQWWSIVEDSKRAVEFFREDEAYLQAEFEARLKEVLEVLEEARRNEEEARANAEQWRRMVEESRRAVYFVKVDEASLEAELKAEEARMKAG